MSIPAWWTQRKKANLLQLMIALGANEKFEDTTETKGGTQHRTWIQQLLYHYREKRLRLYLSD
jgi:hypothetical protein